MEHNAPIASRKALPENPDLVRVLYRASAKLIYERIRRKRKSQRKMAKELGISPTQLRRMRRNPERVVSMKTMIKVIRSVNPAPPKTKRRPVRSFSLGDYITVCAK